jgi:3' terminal RNA ribose 2'-O-methyltransferase Hen1
MKLADALSHIYVLIPVLDDDKHYWVGDDEVEKLIDKGGAWLGAHPAKDLIARRYFKNRRSLARAALVRLAPDTAPEEAEAPKETREDQIEKPLRLNDARQLAVIEALAASGAKAVADLGCGEGKLIARLLRDKRFDKLIGLDASLRSLERASEKMKLNQPGGPREGHITLLHGSLTYRDARWADADAATLVEVIEHLDQDRLPALAKIVFGATRPKTVIVTTPNIEHNVLFVNLAAGAFRHPDHRFEWTRAEFRTWAAQIETEFGYRAAFSEIGETNALHGAPTQMAVFTR